nr:hypothetical protein [uncultured Celeribacter sp.]
MIDPYTNPASSLGFILLFLLVLLGGLALFYSLLVRFKLARRLTIKLERFFDRKFKGYTYGQLLPGMVLWTVFAVHMATITAPFLLTYRISGKDFRAADRVQQACYPNGWNESTADVGFQIMDRISVLEARQEAEGDRLSLQDRMDILHIPFPLISFHPDENVFPEILPAFKQGFRQCHYVACERNRSCRAEIQTPTILEAAIKLNDLETSSVSQFNLGTLNIQYAGDTTGELQFLISRFDGNLMIEMPRFVYTHSIPRKVEVHFVEKSLVWSGQKSTTSKRFFPSRVAAGDRTPDDLSLQLRMTNPQMSALPLADACRLEDSPVDMKNLKQLNPDAEKILAELCQLRPEAVEEFQISLCPDHSEMGLKSEPACARETLAPPELITYKFNHPHEKFVFQTMARMRGEAVDTQNDLRASAIAIGDQIIRDYRLIFFDQPLPDDLAVYIEDSNLDIALSYNEPPSKNAVSQALARQPQLFMYHSKRDLYGTDVLADMFMFLQSAGLLR